MEKRKYTKEEIILLLKESARKYRLTEKEKKTLLERILKSIRAATRPDQEEKTSAIK